MNRIEDLPELVTLGTPALMRPQAPLASDAIGSQALADRLATLQACITATMPLRALHNAMNKVTTAPIPSAASCFSATLAS